MKYTEYNINGVLFRNSGHTYKISILDSNKVIISNVNSTFSTGKHDIRSIVKLLNAADLWEPITEPQITYEIY